MNTVRMLFLDDSKERRDIVMNSAAELSDELGVAVKVDTVETAEQAISALGKREFDIISLDHDLGNEIYCPSDRTDTGAEVTRWVRDHVESVLGCCCWIVHSLNDGGVKTMISTLADARIRANSLPFVWHKDLLASVIKEVLKARAGEERSVSFRAPS